MLVGLGLWIRDIWFTAKELVASPTVASKWLDDDVL